MRHSYIGDATFLHRRGDIPTLVVVIGGVRLLWFLVPSFPAIVISLLASLLLVGAATFLHWRHRHLLGLWRMSVRRLIRLTTFAAFFAQT